MKPISAALAIIASIAVAGLLSSCSADNEQDAAKVSTPKQPIVVQGHGPDTLPHVNEATTVSSAVAVEPAAPVRPVPTDLAEARLYEVRAAVTRFEPMVLFISPGDSVSWVNMAGHNTHAIENMIPAGTEMWESKLGETYTHKFTKSGAYVYQCVPHASLGMQGVIVVGDGRPENLDTILSSPLNKGMTGRALRIMEKALDAHNG